MGVDECSSYSSYQELEDLRSEQGDNHLLAQPDLEEDYQRRYSSASGPDNQVNLSYIISGMVVVLFLLEKQKQI